MKRKDRILIALKGQVPDRPPISFRADSRLMQNILDYYGAYDINELYAKRGIDGLNLWGWHNLMPGMLKGDSSAWDGREIFWGWINPGRPALDECDSIELLTKSQWPSVNDFDFSQIYQQALEILELDMVVSAAYVFFGFQAHASLRGNEKVFFDLYNPLFMGCLIERMLEFNLKFMDKLLTCGRGQIELVQISDDVGSMDRLLLNPDMWRSYYKPGFQKIIDLIHHHEAMAWFHSCGYVGPLLEDFIEMGIDCWNPFDPWIRGNNRETIKRICGGKISLDGGVPQRLFIEGSSEDVRNETQSVLEIFSPQGGLLIGPTQRLTNDVPLENVIAFFETVLD